MRRKKQEEHVNHERWLVSYADFITLLFAFFTSLYAISTVDSKKAGELVFSTRAAFNLEFFPSKDPVLGQQSPSPPMPNERIEISKDQLLNKINKGGGRADPTSSKQRPIDMGSVADMLTDAVAQNRLQEAVAILPRGNTVLISITEAALFPPGTAKLTSKALRTLDPILNALIDTGSHIRVEGHTDATLGGQTRNPYRDWKLSIQRASQVLRYLIEEFAFPPERLSAAGYGSYKPRGDNLTASGRRQNRRVDLVLHQGTL